jgi:hypothetical protein
MQPLTTILASSKLPSLLIAEWGLSQTTHPPGFFPPSILRYPSMTGYGKARLGKLPGLGVYTRRMNESTLKCERNGGKRGNNAGCKGPGALLLCYLPEYLRVCWVGRNVALLSVGTDGRMGLIRNIHTHTHIRSYTHRIDHGLLGSHRFAVWRGRSSLASRCRLVTNAEVMCACIQQACMRALPKVR